MDLIADELFSHLDSWTSLAFPTFSVTNSGRTHVRGENEISS